MLLTAGGIILFMYVSPPAAPAETAAAPSAAEPAAEKITDAVPEEAIVTGTSLRVREKPALDSKEIIQIPEFTVVQVTDSTDKPQRIDSMEAKWYKVKARGREGWCYGGYLAFHYESNSDDTISIWRNNSWDEIIIIRYVKSGTFKKINMQGATTMMSVSGSFRYLAVDSGTDVIRGLTVYDIRTAQEVYDASYYDSFSWNGDALVFKRVTYTGDCCILWEDTVFQNGTARLNGQKGKDVYHCTKMENMDGKCKNFKAE